MKKILSIILVIFLLNITGSALNEPTALQSTHKTDKEITISFVPNTTWYNTSIELNGIFVTNYTQNITLQTHVFSELVKSTNYTISIRSYNATSVYSDYVNISVVTMNMASGVMNPIWDLIVNVVDNTSSIIGLIIIGVLIAVMLTIKRFMNNTINKSMRK